MSYEKLARRFIPLRFKEFVYHECCFLSSLGLLTSSAVHPLNSVCLGFHLFVNRKNLLNMRTLPLLLSFLLLNLAVLSTAILFVVLVLVSVLVSPKEVRRVIKYLGQEWGFVVVAPNFTHEKAGIFRETAKSILFHQLYLPEEWRLIGPVFYVPQSSLFSSFQTKLWSCLEAPQTLISYLNFKFKD